MRFDSRRIAAKMLSRETDDRITLEISTGGTLPIDAESQRALVRERDAIIDKIYADISDLPAGPHEIS